jgi:hypothetical protein
MRHTQLLTDESFNDIELEGANPTNGILDEILTLLRDKQGDLSSEGGRLRHVLQTIGTGVSLPAGVPFIGLAQSFANGNKPYGYGLSAGTVISYANVCFWSYLSLIDEFFRKSNDSQKKKIVKWGIPSTLGVTSAIPSLYLAYRYNNQSLVWPAVNLASSMGFRVYGYYRGVNSIIAYTSKRLSKKNPYAYALRDEIAQACHHAAKSINLIKALKIYELYNDQGNLTSEGLRELFYRISTLDKIGYSHLSPIQGRIKTYGRLSGAFLPVAQIMLNAILTYDAFSLLTDSVLIKIPLTSMAIFPDAALLTMSAVQMLGNMFGLGLSAYNHSDDGRNVLTYNFKLTLILYTLSIVIAAFSYGANAFAIEDNFAFNVTRILLPLFIIADTIFHTYVLSSNSTRLVENVTEKYGSDDTKVLLSEERMLHQLGNVVEEMSGENIVRLDEALATLPNEDSMTTSVIDSRQLLLDNRPHSETTSTRQKWGSLVSILKDASPDPLPDEPECLESSEDESVRYNIMSGPG